MRTLLPILLTLLGTSLIFGCGAGDGTGLDAQGQPIGEQPEPVPEPTGIQANLASIQDNVLTPICSQCHAGNNAPLGLRMDDLQTSIANLIDVDAVTNPAFKRVASGQNAEQSFLFLKIIGDPQAGNQMPLGQPPLPQNTIAVFRTWIESGAPIDAQQLVVAKTSIKHNQDKATASVGLRFSQPIDPASLTSDDIQVIVANNDTRWLLDSSALTLDWVNPSQLELTVPTEADVTQLSIELNQANLTSVFSQSGVWLDGDRDGFPGGEFHYEHQF